MIDSVKAYEDAFKASMEKKHGEAILFSDTFKDVLSV